jgi:hypothetical protein
MDYIVASGNIVDGLIFYGPYTDEEMYGEDDPAVFFWTEWGDEFSILPLEPKPTLS